MDQFNSLCNTLNETIKNETDLKKRDILIKNHIESILKFDFEIQDFVPGLHWFNTTEALSLHKQLKGKIVVLDFFTYCCINCLHILPQLKLLEENFSSSESLVVIGVHSAKFDNEKDSSNILAAIQRYEISHPVVNDANCFMWNELDISCWPTLVILGPKGQPLFSLVGEGHKEELFLYVKSCLSYFRKEISSHRLPVTISSHSVVLSDVLSYPGKVTAAIDKNGNEILAISDTGNHRIILATPEGNIKVKIGGRTPGFKDGNFEMCRFHSPQGLVFDGSTLYVADTENHAIRKIDLENETVFTIAGTGSQGNDFLGGKNREQEISSPWDVCIALVPPCVNVRPSFSCVPLTDYSKSNDSANLPPPPPLLPPPPPVPPSNLSSVPLPPPPPCILNNSQPINKPSNEDRSGKETKVLFIAMAGTHQIWAIFLETTVWWKGVQYEKDTCAAIAGCGAEENRNNNYPMMAGFSQPSGLTWSKELNSLFIGDSESSSIRRLSLSDGKVTAVVGGDRSPVNLFSYGDVDGKSYEAKFQHPLGAAWNNKYNLLYVADTYNHKLKAVNVKTLTSQSVKLLHSDDLKLNEPGGVCTSPNEERLYVADTNNNCIKVIHLEDKVLNKIELKDVEQANLEKIKDIINWEENTSINTLGGKISLNITLQPESVHGQWSINFERSSSHLVKGSFDTNNFNLIIDVPSSIQFQSDTTEFDVHMKIVICTPTTCEINQTVLKVNVTFRESADQNITLYLNKSLL